MFDPIAETCIRCEKFFQKIEQVFGVHCFRYLDFFELI